mgnify:CR=1 FL=1
MEQSRLVKIVIALFIVILILLAGYVITAKYLKDAGVNAPQLGLISSDLSGLEFKLYEGKISNSPEKTEKYEYQLSEDKHLQIIYKGEEDSIKVSVGVFKQGDEIPVFAPRQIIAPKDRVRLTPLPTNLQVGKYDLLITMEKEDSTIQEIGKIIFEVK